MKLLAISLFLALVNCLCEPGITFHWYEGENCQGKDNKDVSTENAIRREFNHCVNEDYYGVHSSYIRSCS